jgi:hypothetical protein
LSREFDFLERALAQFISEACRDYWRAMAPPSALLKSISPFNEALN